jgi:hypothetical protein
MTILNSILGHAGQDRIHVAGSNNPNPNNTVPLVPTQIAVPRQSQNINGGNQRMETKRHDQIERATSPVDERILNEFYSDRPKDMHQYRLEGRRYVVYEGKTFADIEPHRKGKE